jgi:PIN domain nuclease of toxin-antitoxin system
MPGRILLDTHVVVDIATPQGFAKMPLRVRRILEDPEVELLLSVASEAEVAIKSRIGKLQLSRSEFATICSSASILSYPLRRHHTDRLFNLPLHHNDPFDRLIISTALADDVPVVSRDQCFRKYKGLRVIWQ